MSLAYPSSASIQHCARLQVPSSWAWLEEAVKKIFGSYCPPSNPVRREQGLAVLCASIAAYSLAQNRARTCHSATKKVQIQTLKVQILITKNILQENVCAGVNIPWNHKYDRQFLDEMFSEMVHL